ncbi:MAG: hypothetical protein RLZZ543_1723, partial [Bacteroidota bacterium]
MRKRILLYFKCLVSLLFIVMAQGLFGQTVNQERFAVTSGSLPAIFSIDAESEAITSARRQDVIEEKLAERMYLETNYRLLNLLHSGDIYVNDELTSFLENMLDRMLQAQPELKEELRIIATRNADPNAFCLPNGVIVVNVGLIALLENPSQLASVLAHEISHYKKQHGLKKQKSGKEMGKDENLSSKAGLYRLLLFSRE